MAKAKNFGKEEFADFACENPMSQPLANFINAKATNTAGNLYIAEYDSYCAGQQAAQSVVKEFGVQNIGRSELERLYGLLRTLSGAAKDAARLAMACALRKAYNQWVFSSLVSQTQPAA